MFKKLTLKLVLTNLITTGLIFIFIFVGVYITAGQTISNPSKELLKAMAPKIQILPKDKFSLSSDKSVGVVVPKSSSYPLFIINTDDNGKVTDFYGTSGLLKSDTENAQNLADKAISLQNTTDVFNNDEAVYRFQVIKGHVNGMYIVLININIEVKTMALIRTILGISGGLGLILFFSGSLFLTRKALVPIKEAWQRQLDFTADASHELRTPLAVVQTNLEYIMSNPNETIKENIEFLQYINDENKQMTKLVGDLLMLARADTNQDLLEMSFFPLHQTLEGVVKAFEPMAMEKNINLRIIRNDSLDFLGDKGRIRQLVTILVDNAVKYTPNGGSIELLHRFYGNYSQITVTDSGEGISEEHIHKIFDRFYRVDKARSREIGGSGLGLAIADWIIKKHDGNISVESSPGNGTFFTITLPIKHK